MFSLSVYNPDITHKVLVFFTLFCLVLSCRKNSSHGSGFFVLSQPTAKRDVKLADFCLMTGQLLDWITALVVRPLREQAWCGISDISCVCRVVLSYT